jgi:hypothetical protein
MQVYEFAIAKYGYNFVRNTEEREEIFLFFSARISLQHEARRIHARRGTERRRGRGSLERERTKNDDEILSTFDLQPSTARVTQYSD